MRKNPTNQRLNRKKRDEVASIIAAIHGVSARYVRMVVSGEAKNDQILIDYLNYKIGKNRLIDAIKKSAPFNKN
jgi:hypothetical protein